MDRKRSVRRGGRRGHYKKPLSEKLKDYFRNFIAFMFSNVGIIGLVVGYTIAGAFIFIAIEDLPAKQRWTRVEKLRSATAFRLWTLTQNLNVFDEQHWRTNCEMELNAFQKSIVEAIIDGYTLDSTSNSTQWSFSGAFLYSLTVITTIGYGNVSPRTEWGKVTTIVYAIIGMPLFLLYLSNIGDILARSFKWTYARCCLCRWCPNVAQRRAQRRRRRERARRRQQLAAVVVEGSTATPSWQRRQSRGEFLDAGAMHLQRLDAVNEDEDSEDDDSEDVATMAEYDPQQVTVPVTICLAMMVGYVCGGAILFSRWEEWDFLDSSYFCFISLSTIGFGDFVPGDKIYSNDRIQLSFIFCSMYLYLGMALIAMCFNLMQEEVVHKIRSILKGIKHMCRCNR